MQIRSSVETASLQGEKSRARFTRHSTARSARPTILSSAEQLLRFLHECRSNTMRLSSLRAVVAGPPTTQIVQTMDHY